MPDGEEAHDAASCDAALTHAFGFLGKRWNGIILATLLNGPAGYAQLRRAVSGISDSTLSERLAGLSAVGLVQRTVCAGPPLSVAYQLTAAGEALRPTLRELTLWANAHLLPECPAEAARQSG